jgi:predicted transcriptional regulator
MKVKEIPGNFPFKVLNSSESADEKEIGSVYCCDLLSIAMSRMSEEAAWVTVMSNLNTLAVASLTDVSCVILAEGVAVEDNMLSKAKEQGIALFSTELPVFEAASMIGKAIAK